jgi:hypothetical protein
LSNKIIEKESILKQYNQNLINKRKNTNDEIRPQKETRSNISHQTNQSAVNSSQSEALAMNLNYK